MKKIFFHPYATWKNFVKKPTTVRYPKEDIDVFDAPGSAPTYRGLHIRSGTVCRLRYLRRDMPHKCNYHG